MIHHDVTSYEYITYFGVGLCFTYNLLEKTMAHARYFVILFLWIVRTLRVDGGSKVDVCKDLEFHFYVSSIEPLEAFAFSSTAALFENKSGIPHWTMKNYTSDLHDETTWYQEHLDLFDEIRTQKNVTFRPVAFLYKVIFKPFSFTCTTFVDGFDVTFYSDGLVLTYESNDPIKASMIQALKPYSGCLGEEYLKERNEQLFEKWMRVCRTIEKEDMSKNGYSADYSRDKDMITCAFESTVPWRVRMYVNRMEVRDMSRTFSGNSEVFITVGRYKRKRYGQHTCLFTLPTGLTYQTVINIDQGTESAGAGGGYSGNNNKNIPKPSPTRRQIPNRDATSIIPSIVSKESLTPFTERTTVPLSIPSLVISDLLTVSYLDIGTGSNNTVYRSVASRAVPITLSLLTIIGVAGFAILFVFRNNIRRRFRIIYAR